jgi:hypothetical protein
MDRILEKLVFPAENLTYTVRGLRPVPEGAILRERSKVGGKVDSRLLMIRTLEMGVVEPRLDSKAARALVREYPEVALRLAVYISELTTGKQRA